MAASLIRLGHVDNGGLKVTEFEALLDVDAHVGLGCIFFEERIQEKQLSVVLFVADE